MNCPHPLSQLLPRAGKGGLEVMRRNGNGPCTPSTNKKVLKFIGRQGTLPRLRRSCAIICINTTKQCGFLCVYMRNAKVLSDALGRNHQIPARDNNGDVVLGDNFNAMFVNARAKCPCKGTKYCPCPKWTLIEGLNMATFLNLFALAMQRKGAHVFVVNIAGTSVNVHYCFRELEPNNFLGISDDGYHISVYGSKKRAFKSFEEQHRRCTKKMNKIVYDYHKAIQLLGIDKHPASTFKEIESSPHMLFVGGFVGEKKLLWLKSLSERGEKQYKDRKRQAQELPPPPNQKDLRQFLQVQQDQAMVQQVPRVVPMPQQIQATVPQKAKKQQATKKQQDIRGFFGSSKGVTAQKDRTAIQQGVGAKNTLLERSKTELRGSNMAAAMKGDLSKPLVSVTKARAQKASTKVVTPAIMASAAKAPSAKAPPAKTPQVASYGSKSKVVTATKMKTTLVKTASTAKSKTSGGSGRIFTQEEHRKGFEAGWGTYSTLQRAKTIYRASNMRLAINGQFIIPREFYEEGEGPPVKCKHGHQSRCNSFFRSSLGIIDITRWCSECLRSSDETRGMLLPLDKMRPHITSFELKKALESGKKFHISDADKDPKKAEFEVAKEKGLPEGWSVGRNGQYGLKFQKPGYHVTPHNMKSHLRFGNLLDAISCILEEGKQQWNLDMVKTGVKMLIDRKPPSSSRKKLKNRFGNKLIEWSKANPDLYRSALNSMEQDRLKVKKENVLYEFDDLDCYDEVEDNDCCDEEEDDYCEIWEPNPPVARTTTLASKVTASETVASKTATSKTVTSKAAASKVSVEEEDDDYCEIWEPNPPMAHITTVPSKATASETVASKTATAKTATSKAAAASGILKDASNGQCYIMESTTKKRTKPSESGKAAKKGKTTSVRREGKTIDDAIELD